MTINSSRSNTIVENNTESIDSCESSVTEGPSIDGGPSTAVRRQAALSRKNGWSWPLHPRQVIAWVVLVFIVSYYFGTIATALWTYYIYPGYIIPGVLALVHIITQFGCVSINPADPNVRGRDLTVPLPAFDRSKHAHVIENLYCNICETNVTDEAKHCSYCNKCIETFDHHCFWLNNCIGGRNYRIFIVCLISALLFCLIVGGVTICEIVLYFVNIELLYSDWPSPTDGPTTPIPSSPVLSNNDSLTTDLTENGGRLFIYMTPSSNEIWLAIAFFYLLLNLLAMGLIGHLLGFHVYLMSRNLSTYSYIMLMREREMAKREKAQARAKDKLSCSAKNRGRIAPSENDQLQQQSEGDGKKSVPSEEEKRSFGMELRNGVGEKTLQQPIQLTASPAWVDVDAQTPPADSKTVLQTNSDMQIMTTSMCKRSDISACESSSKETSPPEITTTTTTTTNKPKERRKKKTQHRRAKTDPPLPTKDLAREIRNYELELGVRNASATAPIPRSEVDPYGINKLSQRRRSAGADSGVAISPALLPPLVNPPPYSIAKAGDTEVTFGSPLTEIPIDDLKSFYRSEIQYVNFA